MQVNKTAGEIARADAIQRLQQSGTASVSAGGEVSPVRRADEVQISDEGRALAAGEGSDAAQQLAGVDPKRVEEIRNKILSGAYNSVEMADSVARAILRSGDL